MRDNFLPRIAGVFAILSVVANFGAFGIGVSRGLSPPNAMDFGSSDDLVNLALNYEAHILPLALSLLSPCLGIPMALGWFHSKRGQGIRVVWGSNVLRRNDVRGHSGRTRISLGRGTSPCVCLSRRRVAIRSLRFGATLGLTRDVLGYVGHFFSFGLAQIAFGFAILSVRAVPRWLGWLSFVPGIALGWHGCCSVAMAAEYIDSRRTTVAADGDG